MRDNVILNCQIREGTGRSHAVAHIGVLTARQCASCDACVVPFNLKSADRRIAGGDGEHRILVPVRNHNRFSDATRPPSRARVGTEESHRLVDRWVTDIRPRLDVDRIPSRGEIDTALNAVAALADVDVASLQSDRSDTGGPGSPGIEVIADLVFDRVGIGGGEGAPPGDAAIAGRCAVDLDGAIVGGVGKRHVVA